MKPRVIKYNLAIGVNPDKLEQDLIKKGFLFDDRSSTREHFKFINHEGQNVGIFKGKDLFVNPYTDKLEDNILIKFLDSYDQSKNQDEKE